MNDLTATTVRALQISERLSHQGNLLEAAVFSSVALSAMQAQSMGHLKNKLSVSLVSEAAEVLMPLWEKAESGRQREDAAHQAGFLADIMSGDFLTHLEILAPETLRRVEAKRAGGVGAHRAVKA